MTLNGRPSQKDQRTDARQHARQLREDTARNDRRRRLLWRGGMGVGLIAAASIVAVLIVATVRPASTGPLNMASDGVLLGSDASGVVAASTVAVAAGEDPIITDPAALANLVNITMYVDYLCSYCGQFEAANAEQIASWVTAGNAAVEIHPIAILDKSSADGSYSTRAANAAACVADSAPNAFLSVNTALFDAQPDEHSTGLTDADLLAVLHSAGVQSEAVTDCVTEQTFASWVGAATDRALTGPLPNSDVRAVTGTPTVLVNGVSYAGTFDDAAAFEEFVLTEAADLDDDEIALAEAQAAAAEAAPTGDTE
jgi:protein-disulfide isomerase